MKDIPFWGKDLGVLIAGCDWLGLLEIAVVAGTAVALDCKRDLDTAVQSADPM